ncbi:YhfT family protein [uncultured Gemmiger sp.]|uniref:YhfT family protein n=1 Tax=uncultured Gemmiger sp. TaxID=1623490 RepID=UPI0025CD0AAC|nr:YhfT family protein [uncultured Gemmiger sp.]
MQITVINVILVAALCALTSFMSHMGMACFHDGIRPVVPEYLEGRMSRAEFASIAFGLSVGFIASVGIGNALSTNLLNPWLLFLATDIIGVACPKKWMAPIFGALWGILCLTGITGINTVLTGLPIDLIGAMGELGGYIVTGFAVFPIVAIVMQFGLVKGIVTAVIVMLFRVLGPTWTFGPTKASISADSWTMLVGVVALVALAITKDLKEKKKDTSLDDNVFSERVARIRKNVPFLMAAGALIALVCNVHVFAGSTVSMFNLADAYASADAAAASQLVKTAAVNEFFRGISFIPLIATTAITTGVYGVAGFTFVYVAGYLAPNPIVAAILGAAIIFVEVMLLSLVGKFLGNFPSMRDASDNIRSAMGTCVEFALIFGSLNAVITMGNAVGNTTLAFMIAATIYLINEITGRKIMKMAIGPVFAIGTGIILNLLYLVGLVTLAA